MLIYVTNDAHIVKRSVVDDNFTTSHKAIDHCTETLIEASFQKLLSSTSRGGSKPVYRSTGKRPDMLGRFQDIRCCPTVCRKVSVA